MRWQQLLARLPEDLSLAELKTLVCPILAANETEQALVYEIYDQCLVEVNALHDSAVEGSPKVWWKKILPWLMLLLGILAVAYYFVGGAEKEEVLSETIDASYIQLSPNETKSVCIKRNKLGNRPKIVRSKLQNSTEIDANLGQFNLDTICLEYTARDTIGADTFQVQLTDINGEQWQTSYFVTIRRVPLDTIVRKVLQKKARPVSAPLFATKELPYPNDIRDLAIPPLNALEKFYQENAKLIKLLLIGLFTALLAKILLARDEKRKKLIADTAPKSSVSPLLSLPKALLSSIKSGEIFYRLLNKFRGRTPDEFYRLSIPKTIAHTIKNAGMVQFKYALQSRPSEFLLLIDEAADGHHLGHLFDLIHEFFQENEVHFERFYWQRDKGLAVNEQYPEGVNPENLQHQYFQSKLLFFTANASVQSNFGEFRKHWNNTFNAWSQAQILVPVVNYLKQKANQKKQTNFSIAPATIEGLQFLLETQHIGAASSSIRKSKAEAFAAQYKDTEGALIPALQNHFPEAVVQWIAATAVYPSLHWPLTLQLGQVVANHQQDISLLSIEHLFSIANLPWFVAGKLSESVRAELIAYLETCLLYTSPSPRDRTRSRMPSSA